MGLLHRIKRATALTILSRGRFFLLRQVKPPLPLSVSGKFFELQGPNTEGARNTYSEVIIEDAYRLRKTKLKAPKVIVDVGANIGLFSAYVAALFPGCKIFAYEPNPESFEFLKKNSELFSNIEINPSAISCKFKEAALLVGGDSTTGFIGAPSGEHLVVKCQHPEQVAPGQEIDLLKLDCEGSEFDILSDPTLLRRSKKCAMEFHLDEVQTMERLLSLVRDGGHKVYGSLPQDLTNCKYGYLYTERSS